VGWQEQALGSLVTHHYLPTPFINITSNYKILTYTDTPGHNTIFVLRATYGQFLQKLF
jgi:hypothetical protein